MKKDELFSILDTAARGIAETFGPNCETLIQDLTTLSHPILSIYNSHVTGRSAGSTTSINDGAPADYALELSKLQSPHINMLAVDGSRRMKSTTIPFVAEDGVLGLGINFDYTAFEQAEQAIKALTAINGFLYEDLRKNQPLQIDSLFREAAQGFDKPIAQLTRQERLMLMRRLKSNHFFEQHKAVPYLAEQLNVSRHTLYKDLKALD
ncbi:MAG: transcriptional regulator [Clostridia bacterium]|nr:transcriptional regulator [Clostridia bacterium]